MKIDTLDALNDSELQAVIARSHELLKSRDEERKAKALSDAKALLASVGLSLKDVASKAHKASAPKGPTYHSGRMYRHPSNNALTWNAKGQKPNWLRELEAGGGKAVEMAANDNNPPRVPVNDAAEPLGRAQPARKN
jgi:DNA-binding protein H-NS